MGGSWNLIKESNEKTAAPHNLNLIIIPFNKYFLQGNFKS